MGVTVPAKRGYMLSAAPPGQRIHAQPTVSPEHAGYQRVDSRMVYAVPSSSQSIPTPPSAESQGAKRRRVGNEIYIPAREVYPEATYSYAHSPGANGTFVRQEIVQHPPQIPVHMNAPRPQMVSPPRGAYPRPPPLQPIRAPHPHQRNRSSVALPPIETMVAQTPTKAVATQSQSSGVEAMIMSIPILNKIKVLAQLSGQLPVPGLTSPKPEVRGAIIAVEGMDAASVNSMTNSLAEQLEKEGKFAVRIFGGPDPYSLLHEARSGASQQKKGTDSYLDLMSQWHKINKEMVEYISSRPGSGSKESPMVLDNGQEADHHITDVDERQNPLPQTPDRVDRIDTPDNEALLDQLDSAISPKTMVKAADMSIESGPVGNKGRSLSTPGLWTNNDSISSGLDTRPPPTTFARPLNSRRIPPPPPTPPPATPPASNTHSRIPPPMPAPAPPKSLKTNNLPSMTNTITSPANAAIPIALVPHFQLTTVDASSISMPINDNFSPPAHWQWFATMWRGSVGPDITIVIRGMDEEPGDGSDVAKAPSVQSKLPGVPTTAGSNGSNGRERIASVASAQSHSGGTGVEIRLHDSRAVIVKTGIFGPNALSPGHVGEEHKVTRTPPTVQQAKETENWEKAKRRVGFEVEEFLRR